MLNKSYYMYKHYSSKIHISNIKDMEEFTGNINEDSTEKKKRKKILGKMKSNTPLSHLNCQQV